MRRLVYICQLKGVWHPFQSPLRPCHASSRAVLDDVSLMNRVRASMTDLYVPLAQRAQAVLCGGNMPFVQVQDPSYDDEDHIFEAFAPLLDSERL